jgi:hypothetical protein
MKICFLIIVSVCINTLKGAPTPTVSYANSLELQPNAYYLFWNFTKTDILFEIQVKTTGWAGFGISPNGGMDGSDVIVTWIGSDGKANFTDRHIKNRDVIVDKTQNWLPLGVTTKDGFLVARFTRKIDICDKSGEDMDIPDGTPFVIFAYGTRFNNNGDIAYHDFRGTASVQLTSAINLKIDLDMSQVETTEYRVDVYYRN